MGALVRRLHLKLQQMKILGAGVVQRLSHLQHRDLPLLRTIASPVEVLSVGAMIFIPMFGSKLDAA